MQNLAEAAHWQLTSSRYRLGRMLSFDAQVEKVIGDAN